MEESTVALRYGTTGTRDCQIYDKVMSYKLDMEWPKVSSIDRVLDELQLQSAPTPPSLLCALASRGIGS